MFSFERDQDTICAICTPPGRGAIAVLRVSGDRALQICREIAGFLPLNPESHKIYYGLLKDPQSRETIDEVLISYFAKGRSFTSEMTVEISCHGGPAISQQILDALLAAGARLAQNGEFTYRAFMSGRIDLVQAEGVLAAIESQSALGARVSLRQLKGELSNTLTRIEDHLTWALSRLEANLDFSSEFIEFARESEIVERITSAHSEVASLLGSYKKGRVLREGLKVALIGAPNVGKSSLLNAIAQEERAIVSPVAGTTRDTVEVTISLAGQKVTLVDTAGIRETQDEIEALGVARALSAAREADLVIEVFDATEASGPPMLDAISRGETPYLAVLNKSDLLSTKPVGPHLQVSAKTRSGLTQLLSKVQEHLWQAGDENSAVLQNARHSEQLAQAEHFLKTGLELMQAKASSEFVIAEVREALISVMRVLGRQFDDEVLDRVFKDFCLGK